MGREINILRSQNENLAAAEIMLTKDLANVRKLLKESEGKVKEAEQQGRAKSKEHSEFARNDRERFGITRKSINDLIEINRTSASNIINVVTNTRTACKFMVNEVTKKFEEFEAELGIMNNSAKNASHVDAPVNSVDENLSSGGSEVSSRSEEANNNQEKMSKVRSNLSKRKVGKHEEKYCALKKNKH